MKKLLALVLSLMLLMTASAVFAEGEAPGEVLMGQVEFAAHGDRGFAVITVALQDDVILGAKIDEFQFMGDREDLKAVGVPNSDGAFGEAYPEGQVLGSKRGSAPVPPCRSPRTLTPSKPSRRARPLRNWKRS